MIIKPHEKRNDDLLLQQFKMVMDKLVPLRRKGYVSGPDFDKCCKELYGSSIRGSLQNRFGSGKGRQDGFNIVKEKLGYSLLRTYSKQEVLDIYINIYQKNRKQPTEGDIEKIVSMNTVYRHFGRHMNAVDEMLKALGIDGKGIYPVNIKLNPAQKIGEDIRRFGLNIEEAPVNEQGVVFIFAKTHQLLGFPIIERPQQEFPDCRSTCIRTGVLTRVNIEFKYNCAAAFKKGRGIDRYHGQKINYLICWINDSIKNTAIFSRAGIEVISLKDELEKFFVQGKLNKITNVEEPGSF
jgi:hypothetical protein